MAGSTLAEAGFVLSLAESGSQIGFGLAGSDWTLEFGLVVAGHD